MPSSSNASDSTSSSPIGEQLDGLPSFIISTSDASAQGSANLVRSDRDYAEQKHNGSGDYIRLTKQDEGSNRPNFEATERHHKACDDSRPIDWTNKLRRAQMKIEAVCPFCRHVICSQRCQDKQRLRFAWDAWADAVEPPADTCAGREPSRLTQKGARQRAGE